MAFLSKPERAFLDAVSKLASCNPFQPQRVDYEREALGEDFESDEAVWSMRVADPEKPRPNTWKIHERVESMAGPLRERVLRGEAARERDLILYEDAILFFLYHRYVDRLFENADPAKSAAKKPWGFYGDFLRDWNHYFDLRDRKLPSGHEPGHTFACFSQISRAFLQIFTYIIGSSLSAARLRAAVWQSVFTHDIQRYRRVLYANMGDFATLITGPSGTGKELVARAIALSRYLPFDAGRMMFPSDASDSFRAINLAALSPTLIESELFGHRRGAFTGAVQDRKGWLEMCPPLSSVFLDEIGDLDAAIQVKLLRVIETRQFQPVGDNSPRIFHGKLIAATNRDLGALMRSGGFREDFYYRLCSDQIVTPSLCEQLRESPEVLRELILFMTRRVCGAEAEALAAEVEDWVRKNLGLRYEWPGNYRELEQCVRNVVIRREYRPPSRETAPPGEALAEAMEQGTITADELLRRYCTMVYAATGSYEETARRLQMDRRTVKSRVDEEQLERLKEAESALG
ncbi:MAG: sigma 54-interacting transcriptional regulator [Bryobacterales bacterium]